MQTLYTGCSKAHPQTDRQERLQCATITMPLQCDLMRLQCAGCSKAEPKIFTPPQTPFPGVQDGQNLISWRWSLPLPTDPVWWRSMHAISSYRGNRPI